MHNKDGEIIFLGKSNNIKKRVNRHFLRSGDLARQIQKETKKVTYEKTGSELVALLKENEELVKNQPKYNTQGKKIAVSNKNHQVKINGYDILSDNLIIVDKGREFGERSAILIKNGEFTGLGFYNLNYQINNIHILESIITPMNNTRYTSKIIESYLRDKKVLEIIELKNQQ